MSNYNESIQPWVEKYRPKDIDSVSSQEQTIAVLKTTLKSQNLPHMLFYGPPGTGKTSTILALAHELFGPELMKSRVLELNASDERGIQVIREKVKNFARATVSRHVSEYPCPPYKIIILDEADSLTHDAQTALRRIMENYSRITRFCLICNYVSRIIEPLTSRCAKFRFKPLDISSAKKRIEHICENENINYDPKAIDEILKISNGDLRKSIMFLQSAARLHQNERITADSILEIGGVVPDDIIDKLIETAYMPINDESLNLIDNIIASGFSAVQIMSQICDKVVVDEQLNNDQKACIGEVLGEIDKELCDGADDNFQPMKLLINFSEI
ncbi:14995_t:CDS:2, partial [Entrophospora sp. SA101]